MVLEVSRYVRVKDAVARALALLPPPRAEALPTRKTFGRTAAEDVVSRIDLPQFASSHFDGYAVAARTTVGATAARPVRLSLVGSASPGRRPELELGPGEAARVFTGSFLPAGADSVVPLEEGRVIGGKLSVTKKLRPGTAVFAAGEDIKRGDVVVKKGSQIRAQEVGMLLTLGVRKVKVWRRATVAVLATGNELTNSTAPRTFKTRNSHTSVFAALSRALCCEVIDLGIARDRVGDILGKLRIGLRKSEVVFMTGGTSVGKLDLSEEVLAKLRPRFIAHGVRMDRGRVAGLAVVGGKGVVMMPGPMQGAMNAFLLFGLPMIAKVAGMGGIPMTTTARLTRRWEARERFPNFTKVVYLRVFQSRTGTSAEPLRAETESMSLMRDSNAYTVVPENVTSIEAGAEIEVSLLRGFSFV